MSAQIATLKHAARPSVERRRWSGTTDPFLMTQELCAFCIRDADYSDDQPDLGCPIAAKGVAGDPYPDEWVEERILIRSGPDAGHPFWLPICTAFQDRRGLPRSGVGRCPRTRDLFA